MDQNLKGMNDSYLEFFKMSNNEDKINDALIRDALSEMTIHLPPEFILAYARGTLSEAGHAKIQNHLKDCHECSALYKMIQKFLAAENKFDSASTTEKISLPDVLKSKFELFALVNKKKNEITEQVVKLLLPEESWFMIGPAISVLQKWRDKTAFDYKREDSRFLAAAFTSGEELGNKQNFETVNEAMILVSFVCDLIIEKCKYSGDIEHNLANYIDDAGHIAKGIKLDKDVKNKMLRIFLVALTKDE